MATQNGTNYAKAIDPSSANILAAGLWGGKVRVQKDDFTFAGEAAGEVIRVGRLPKGAKFLFAIVTSAALGSGVTLQLGDSGDDDRYMVATAHASAATTISAPTSGIGYETTAETIVNLTTAGGAATGLVETLLFYAQE